MVLGCVCGSGSGTVVVAELEKVQFRQVSSDVQWWSDDRYSSYVWRRSDVRCLGDFGHGMNFEGSWWGGKIGAKLGDFVDEEGGDGGEKLDPLVAKHIHGSNLKKLHQN